MGKRKRDSAGEDLSLEKHKSHNGDDKHFIDYEEPRKRKRKKSRHNSTESEVMGEDHLAEHHEPRNRKKKKRKHKTETENIESILGSVEGSTEDCKQKRKKHKKEKREPNIEDEEHSVEYLEPKKHKRKKSRHKTEESKNQQEEKSDVLDIEEMSLKNGDEEKKKVTHSEVMGEDHLAEHHEPQNQKKKRRKHKTEPNIEDEEHSVEYPEPKKHKRKNSRHKTEEIKNQHEEKSDVLDIEEMSSKNGDEEKETSDVLDIEMSSENDEEGAESKVIVDEETIERRKHEWQEKTSLKKLRMQQPKLFLIDNFTNDEDQKSTFKPVVMRDLQDLLQYSVLANAGSVNRVRFCKLVRPFLVEKVVLVVFKGVSEKHFQENSACFPYLTASYDVTGQIQRHQTEQETIVNQLLYVAVSKIEMKKRRYLAKNRENYKMPDAVVLVKPKLTTTGNKPGRMHYLLTDGEKQTWRYPDPDDPTNIHTKHSDTVTDESPMISVDCEMCVTKNGSELTRVSLVDEKYNVLYNSLVKPHNPIIDYLTRYSGITKQLLDPVTTRLSDVQRDIIAMLPHNAILIGQSLENDLRALKLYHPHVVDTSHMFTGSYRVALRKLALKYLGQTIQSHAAGHDSVEDATVCMKLVQLKIARGEDLEKYTFNNGRKMEDAIPTESLFRCAHSLKKVSMLIDGTSVAKQFVKDPVGVIACQSDSEALKKAVHTLPYSQFVSVQFYNFSKLMQGISQDADAVQETLRQLDQRFKKLHKMLPCNSLFLVVMATDTDPESKKSSNYDVDISPGRFFTGLKVQF